MGSVKIDLYSKAKRWDDKYPLDKREGVMEVLDNIHKLRELRLRSGDFHLCDLLLDLQEAIDNGKLTERQRECIELLYEHELTQEEAANVLGIDHSNVSRRKDNAVDKIVAYINKGGV